MTPPVPVGPDRLAELLADLCARAAGSDRLRVAVDGAPAAHPGALADSLVDPIERRGLHVARVRTHDFLRPASVRLECGRTDPDSLHDRWLDAGALIREVLTPLGPDGSGRWLPALWDPVTDRARREPYRVTPPPSVLLLDGPFLLGRGLPFDLAVHVHLSEAALRRRTPPDEAWTFPAYARYAAETAPDTVADVVVRADDPRRPALAVRT